MAEELMIELKLDGHPARLCFKSGKACVVVALNGRYSAAYLRRIADAMDRFPPAPTEPDDAL